MKKLFSLLIMGLFLISFISASCSLPPVKQGDTINLTQVCTDCTYVKLTKIMFPNQTYAFIGDETMTKVGIEFYYQFENTDTIGEYFYTSYGDLSGTDTAQTCSFEVTYSGFQLQEGQGIIYIPLFLVLIFFFVIIIFAINQLPSSNQKDEEGRILSITYLKYLRPVGWMFEYMLVVAMLYLSSNLAFAYLNEQLFAKILFLLFRLSFMFAPVFVIVWMIWIFVKMFHDKQFQQILNRGFFPQGKL